MPVSNGVPALVNAVFSHACELRSFDQLQMLMYMDGLKAVSLSNVRRYVVGSWNSGVQFVCLTLSGRSEAYMRAASKVKETCSTAWSRMKKAVAR